MSAPVLFVAGARPNFMKVAPLLAAARRHPGIEPVLVSTGQHYDDTMAKVFFDELGIGPPDVELGVGSASHARQTALILERFEPVLLARRPRLTVVVGDVNSTMACSLAATKLGVAVAHVEAGLRSFDRTMPEEINRVVTDAISDLLFASEPAGVDNLRREGVPAERIHLVGNVMIDTLRAQRERARASDVLDRLGLEPGRYAVVTLHRPANVDDPAALSRILQPIVELSRRMPVVFPVHPRTRPAIATQPVFATPGHDLRPVSPLGYRDFLRLMSDARLVLTDSGGVQEETTILGVACVTIRDNTERPITLTEGTNRLAGTTAEGISRAIGDALGPPAGTARAPALWDGHAAERILEVLASWVGA